MNPKIYWVAIVLFTAVTANGQVESALNLLEQYEARMTEALRKISYPIRSKSDHFLYLNKNWQNSFAISLDDKIINFNGRFNIMNSGIEMKYEDKVRTIYPEKIKIAKVGDNIILPLRSMDVEGLDKITYFELLSTGSIKLLCKYSYGSQMVDGNSLVPQVTGERSYETDEEFYYTQAGKIEKLRSSKKKILELFEDKSVALEDFIKAERIRVNKKEDLIKLFDHYNSLE